MNITFLGTSARELENRNAVSILIEEDFSNLLIDCGPSIISGIIRSNKNVSDINNVLLTHVHGDHISSFAYFVWYRNIERMGKEPPRDLNVYGQKDTIKLAQYNLEHMYPEIKWPFKVNFHEIDEKSTFNCDTLKVRTIEAIHTVPCLGCIVESKGKKIAYSGDSLPNKNNIEYIKNADLLIHDVMLEKSRVDLANKTMHSTPESVGKIATEANVKMLALVHIEPSAFKIMNTLIKETKEEYSKIITIPTEGTIYSI